MILEREIPDPSRTTVARRLRHRTSNSLPSKKHNRQGLTILLCLFITAPLLAAGPTTAPARTREQIMADFNQSKERLGTEIGNPRDVADPAKRVAIAAKAIPELKRLVGFVDELAALDPNNAEGAVELKDNFKTLMFAMGDGDAAAEFNALAVDPDSSKALRGKAAQITAKWLQSANSPDALTALGDELIGLDRANPDSQLLTKTTVFLSQATSDHLLTNRMVHAATQMTNPYAARLKPVIADAPPPGAEPTTKP